ncbi:MAG: tetratricopeptide repeat protein [Myxococcales bacterium]|nr:tetratricopeptide repeat protein [Myxococcales bacterium]
MADLASLLALLDRDADEQTLWGELAVALAEAPAVEAIAVAQRLCDRGAWQAAVRWLALVEESLAARGEASQGHRAGVLAEQARVAFDEGCDVAGAQRALGVAATLGPSERAAEVAAHIADARQRAEESMQGEAEALTATPEGRRGRDGEASSRAVALTRLAESAMRFFIDDERIEGWLGEAVALAPKTRRAWRARERLAMLRGDQGARAAVLQESLAACADVDERKRLYMELVRAFALLGEASRADECAASVLALDPAHPSALAHLADRYKAGQNWSGLVVLLQSALKVRPGDRLEMELSRELGDVLWQRVGDLAAAEESFTRVRRGNPADATMLEFFRALLASRQEVGKFASFLRQAERHVLAQSPPDTARARALALDAARTIEASAPADAAIEAWKHVARADAASAEAKAALRRLYEASGKWNALLEIWKEELERLPPDDVAARTGILMQIAAIYRDRLKLDVMVVNTYVAILKLDPASRSVMQLLADKYRALGRWNDLIALLGRLAESSELAVDERCEVLREIATLWCDRFSNFAQAVRPLERILELRPGDRDALQRLKELHLRRRQWRPYLDVLALELAELDGQAKYDGLLELARVAAEKQGDAALAAATYEQCLAIEGVVPTDALAALATLWERERNWARLADVLGRQAHAATSPERRVAALEKLGATYQDRLGDQARAVEAYQAILALDPGHAKAMRILRELYASTRQYDRLEALYAAAGQSDELVDVLLGAADRTEDENERLQLATRAAELASGSATDGKERAMRAWERVFASSPSHRRAALALRDHYLRTDKWSRLLPVLEALLATDDEGDARHARLLEIRALCEQRLGSKALAFAWTLRALWADPSQAALRADAARLAHEPEQVVELLQLLDEAMEKHRPSAAAALAIIGEQAKLAAQRLHDPALARGYQLRVLALDPGNAQAQAQLEELALSLGDYAGLLALYRQRVERAESAAAKCELLFRIAAMEEERLGDVPAAIATYQAIVAVDQTSVRAFRQLAKLHAGRKSWRGVLDALTGELATASSPESELDLLSRMGQLHEAQLAAPQDAFPLYWRAWQVALRVGLPKTGLLGLLETYLQVPAKRNALASGDRLALAEALLPLLEQRRDGERIASALEIIREESNDAEQRQAIDARLVSLYGGVLANHDAAWDSARRVVEARPFDREARAVLAELASRQARHPQYAAVLAALLAGAAEPSGPDKRVHAPLRALATELAHVCEDPLGDLAGAESAWLTVLGFERDARDAFDALARMYHAAERWDELCDLLNRRIEAVVEDADRIQTLQALAAVEEERRHQWSHAADAYLRLLEIDAEAPTAYRALERLYTTHEQWRAAEELLARETPHLTGKEQLAVLVRRIELKATRLQDAAAALTLAEEVLARNRQEKTVRDLVARLLEDPQVRVRAAALLAPIYEAERRYKELVGVLRIAVEHQPPGPSRCALYLKIAEAEEHGLGAPNAAFASYREALLADASSEVARLAVQRVGAQLSKWGELASLWQLVAADATTDHELRLRYLVELARMLELRLGQPARALVAYESIVSLAGTSAPHVRDALLEIVRLQGTAASPETLASLHHQLANVADSAAGRIDHWQRAAHYERAGGQPERAIATWRYVLAEAPTRQEAYVALEDLLVAAADWPALAALLRQRLDAGGVGVPQAALLTRLAQVYEQHLGDADQAIATYQELIERDPDDAASMVELARLFEAQRRYFDLVDILERRVSMLREKSAPEAGVAQLSADIASLLADKLGRDVEALERWTMLLASPTGRERAELALEAMLARPELTAAVADVLWPHYLASAQWSRVVRLGETLAATDHLKTKLARLGQVARVYEDRLGDRERAFAARVEALKAAVGEPEIMLEINETERLAGLLGKEDALIELYQDIAPRVLDGEIGRRLYLDIAELAQALRQDLALAEASYRSVLATHPDDKMVLGALEVMYRERDDVPALLAILARKTELSGGEPSELLRLWVEMARLYATRAHDQAAAIEAWQQVLLLEPTHREALAALAALYAGSERWHDRREVLLRQLATTRDHAAQVSFCLSLGQLARDHLDDGEAAIMHFDAAMDLDPNNQVALAALEQYLDHPTFGHEAAAAVEPRYVARQQWPQLVKVYEIRLRAAAGPAERNALHRQIARLHEDQLEDLEGAAQWYARVLRDEPHDDATHGELERIVQFLGAWPLLATTYQQILDELGSESARVRAYAWALTQVLDARLHEPLQALQAARRALECDDDGDPTDAQIVAYLERMLDSSGLHAALAEFYRELLGGMGNKGAPLPAAYLELAHKLALRCERALGDADGAIEVYRDMLAIAHDAGDDAAWERAADELQRLLDVRQRWDELVDLTEQRIARLAGDIKESSHRLTLAGLLEARMGDLSAAVDQYEIVLASEVGGERAVAALERLVMQDAVRERILAILEPLYRGRDWWQKLVIILDSKLAYIADPHEQFETLAEVATLHEQRGGDVGFALNAWARAWQLDVDSTQAGDAVLRLGQALAEWPLVVNALHRAKENASDPDRRAFYGAEYAAVVETQLGDLAAALQAWRAVRDVASDATEANLQIERLLLKTSQPLEVAKEWERRALDADGDEREILLSRLANLYEDVLHDHAGAIRTHETLLEQLPGHAASLDALERLYDAAGAAAELARVLAMKLNYADGDGDELRRLRFALAAVYERRLGDQATAVEVYEQALGVDARDIEVLAELRRLYAQREMWPELVDTLERLVEALPDAATARAEALTEAGDIADAKLRETERAVGLYLAALAQAPSHPAARAALFKKAMTDEQSASVIATLLALHRDEGNLEAVEALLSRNVSLAREGVEGLDVAAATAALAAFHETERHQPAQAYQVWRGALAHELTWRAAMAQVERLALGLGNWAQVAGDVRQVLASPLPPEVDYGLSIWLAGIAEERTGDLLGAANALERALLLAPEPTSVLAALERVLAGAQAWPRYLEVVRRQADLAEDDAQRADLFFRLGEVSAQMRGDLDAAVGWYREALASDPSHTPTSQALEHLVATGRGPVDEIVELLERLFRERQAWPKLHHVLAQRVAQTADRAGRAELYRDMYEIASAHLADPLAALDAAGGWLAEAPDEPDALAAVEQLADQTGRWAELAARLDGVAAATDDVARRNLLYLRIGGVLRDKLGDGARAAAAYRNVLASEPRHVDALRALIGVYHQARQAQLEAETCLQLAPVLDDLDERRAMLIRAAELWMGLDQGDAALAAWMAVLATDPYDVAALGQSARLLAQLGRHAEHAAMLRRAIDATSDDTARAALLEQLAAVWQAHLGDGAPVVAAWQERVALRPDLASLRALEAAQRRLGDVEGAIETIRHIVDVTPGPARRDEWGRLAAQLRQAGRPDDAAEAYVAALALDPTWIVGLDALAALWHAPDDAERLAAQWERAAMASAERGDLVNEVAHRAAQVEALLAGGLAREARAPLQAILAKAPQHTQAQLQLAKIAALENDWATVGGLVEQLLTANLPPPQQAELCVMQARLALQRDDLGSARQWYERAVAADANHRPAIKWLYEDALGRGDGEQANTWLLRLLGVEDDASREALVQTWWSGQQPGVVPAHVLEMVPYVREVARRRPRDSSWSFVVADCEIGAGLVDEAQARLLEVADLAKGQRRNRDHARAKERLAGLAMRRGEVATAQGLYEEALKLQPGDPATMAALGALYFEHRDWENARRMYRALVLQPLDASSGVSKGDVYWALGAIHLELGEARQARGMFQRGLELEPQHERLRAGLAATPA